MAKANELKRLRAYLQSIAVEAVDAQAFDPKTENGRESISDLLTDIEGDLEGAQKIIEELRKGGE